jgi:hypothetical protein
MILVLLFHKLTPSIFQDISDSLVYATRFKFGYEMKILENVILILRCVH